MDITGSKKIISNYSFSVTILLYLSLMFIFFLGYSFGGGTLLLNINHLFLFCILLLSIVGRRIQIHPNNFILIGSFFFLLLSSKLASSLFYGALDLKSILVNMLINFSLGYYLCLNLLSLDKLEREKFSSVYKTIIVLIVIFFANQYLSAEKYLGFMIFFPDETANSYQTLTAYLARVLLVGILMYSITSKTHNKAAWHYIYIVGLIFGLLSLLSVSKKETALFFFLASIP